MLEEYRKALQPDSLLDIVPKGVLQSLMQGFFFGFHAGIVLMYDEGKDANGQLILKRLDPVDKSEEQDWREKFGHFNPFCAKFRKNPERNALCEECDISQTRRILAGDAKRKKPQYLCHMKLRDIAIAIKVGNEMRGVIIAGQKIVAEDQKQLKRIREKIVKKALDIQDELENLLTQKDVVIHDKVSVDAFEQSFIKFAESLQVIVDTFTKNLRMDAEKEALLKIREEVGRTLADDSVSWTKSFESLFKELEILVGNKPVWLLQRRGSRFQCVASSPAGMNANEKNLAVPLLIETPIEKLYEVPRSKRLWSELKEKLAVQADEMTLIRSDASASLTDVTSVVLVVATKLPPHLEDFLAVCARALAYPAGVTGLFRRLEKQQSDFARIASFIGHHLKTPLQSVLFSVREIILRLAENTPLESHAESLKLLHDIQKQISLGLADALRLQAAALPPKKEWFDLYTLIAKLVEDLKPLAHRRNITLRFATKPLFSNEIYGVPFQIRIAFFNLLDNAIKYSHENKWIAIRFAKLESLHETKKGQNFIAVEIEDVGVGFPSEHKEQLLNLSNRLNEPSGQWSPAGAGIGLVQANEYLEAAGGSLDIESYPIGTQFLVKVIVHLPIAT